MKLLLKALAGGLWQLVVILAVLAAATVLAVTGHLTAVVTYSVIAAVLTAAGVSAGSVLGSTTSNTTLILHGVLVLAAIGAVIVLAVYNVFTAAQIQPFFATLLAGGIFSYAAFSTVSNAIPVVSTVVSSTPVATASTPPTAIAQGPATGTAQSAG